VEGKLKPSGSSKNATITTILIILILLGLLGAIGYFSGLFYFIGLTPCNPPSWVVVDGVATQKVFAFYDDNQNGLYEESTERALPNITVKLSNETAMTNEKGTTTIFVYKEKCACNCSKGETLSVIIPEGWQTTTPTQFILTGKEETISLGFYK
jgi:hypothetical protein